MKRLGGWTLVLTLMACGCAGDADQVGEGITDAEMEAPDRQRSITADQGTAADATLAADAGEADAAPMSDAAAATDGGVRPDMGAPECSDGVDNDGDGAVDLADRGCDDADDDSEAGEVALPECADGLDNDDDGLIDLDDGDCTSAAAPREQGGNQGGVCFNGEDDDGDGLVDWPNDPGCAGAGDGDEADGPAGPACSDGLDNDEDGETDWPNDPGCQGAGDGDEVDLPVAPACANGADDDDDGATDWPADDGCGGAGDRDETGPCPADVELVELIPGMPRDGTLQGAPGMQVGSCGGAAGGERVFRVRVNERLERLVVSTLHPETTAPTVLYLRRACGVPADFACDRGTDEEPGVTLVVPQPGRGDYFVFVDTGSRENIGAFRLTAEAVPVPACRNEVDDDDDGLVDAADPGCVEADDADEADPAEPPVCANGLDDDGDGDIDHPADADCEFAGGAREAPLCPGDPPVLRLGQEGGQLDLPVQQGNGGSAGSCAPVLGAETVVELTLDEPSDVSVVVTQDGMPVATSVHVRTDCPDPESEIACRASDRAEPLTLTEVPAGRVYILVEQGFVPLDVMRSVSVSVDSILGECNDEVDNDGDGLVDLLDPGCERLRDDSEADPDEVPECADGLDNDEDGLIDLDDDSCVAAGDPSEGGCEGDPLWRPVECQIESWVWSSNRNLGANIEAAAQARTLFTGCNHSNDGNDNGLCSLTGQGWVSTQTWVMAGCNNTWQHLGGRFSGNCGGHDGDTVRRLVLDPDGCWDYTQDAPIPPFP